MDFKSRRSVLLISVVLALVGTIAVTGLLTYQTTQWKQAFEALQANYLGLREGYISLQNDTSTLETYYDDVQEKYSSLKSEYTDLQNRYSSLQREKMLLQNEHDEILNLQKEILLEKFKTLEISPEDNATMFYDVDFGYIKVNFTSSAEVFFWIGSSLTEGIYYTRYPPFPNTVVNGTFVVPVCDDLYILIYNPNLDVASKISLTIKLIY